MLKIICDRCKKDCGLFALDIIMQVIHDPTPNLPNYVGRINITDDDTIKKFQLCSECATELGLPNIYKKDLIFRDKKKGN